MFQFRAFPAYSYFVQSTLTRYCRAGFPHSEISGSMRMCRSPELIAACRVLLRLLMPRHSPCALISLTISGSQKNYAGHRRNFNRSNCSLLPNFHNYFFTPFRALPSVALLLFSSSSIVQFSRCRRRSKTGSKHLNEKPFKCFDPFFVGGDNRNRTDDLLRAKQALSHLSYTPKRALVGQSGLEPPTSRLSVVCSSQLSYWPIPTRIHWCTL